MRYELLCYQAWVLTRYLAIYRPGGRTCRGLTVCPCSMADRSAAHLVAVSNFTHVYPCWFPSSLASTCHVLSCFHCFQPLLCPTSALPSTTRPWSDSRHPRLQHIELPSSMIATRTATERKRWKVLDCKNRTVCRAQRCLRPLPATLWATCADHAGRWLCWTNGIASIIKRILV